MFAMPSALNGSSPVILLAENEQEKNAQKSLFLNVNLTNLNSELNENLAGIADQIYSQKMNRGESKLYTRFFHRRKKKI